MKLSQSNQSASQLQQQPSTPQPPANDLDLSNKNILFFNFIIYL
jgi:hypothetical protein